MDETNRCGVMFRTVRCWIWQCRTLKNNCYSQWPTVVKDLVTSSSLSENTGVTFEHADISRTFAKTNRVPQQLLLKTVPGDIKDNISTNSVPTDSVRDATVPAIFWKFILITPLTSSRTVTYPKSPLQMPVFELRWRAVERSYSRACKTKILLVSV